MAKMIPDIATDELKFPESIEEIFNNSYGEMRVYTALRELPQEYTVLHSVRWQKKKKYGHVKWSDADFVVFNPKRGLIVIEVKSGGIGHDDNGWKYITKTEEYQMKDPLKQAEDSKYAFIERLFGKLFKSRCSWIEPAVWFPSIDNIREIGAIPANYYPDIILTQKDLGNVERGMERIFDHYNMLETLSFNRSDEAEIIHRLSPQFDILPTIASRVNEAEYILNKMTQTQSSLLEYLDEQKVALIQGGAGTGKTMIAVEKAKRLSDTGKVLFLCFNKFLLVTLRKTCAVFYPNIDFYNLPALACRKTGLIDIGGNEGISRFLAAIDIVEWEYSHIVIDEGQDFLEEHLICLKDITEEKNGSFYVFYDKNQLVQQRQTVDWLKSVQCRLILSANCRNTKEIAITSNKTIGIDQVKMRLALGFFGDKPKLYITKSKESTIKCLAQIIRHYIDGGLAKRDIVILTVKTEDTSILSDISSVESYNIVSNINSSEILFTSARKFKGLESNIVILVDMDEKSFEDEESKRVIYVGASRAKYGLDFIAMVTDGQLSQIAEAMQGRNAKSAKAVIASQLKVKMIAFD